MTDPIIVGLDGMLRDCGFLRRASTWNRRLNGYVDVVDLQQSKSREMVTLNAGVLVEAIYRDFTGADAPVFVREVDCIVRSRIGALKGSHDLWWRSSEDGLPQVICQHVDRYILPFFSQMHSDAEIERALKQQSLEMRNYPPPRIYLELLKFESGNPSSACAGLRALQREAPAAWKTRIEEISLRIGCESV